MQLPLGFGRLDFEDWFRGLIAAFVSGGASAVTSGLVVSLNDPKDYAIGTTKFYNLVWSVFVMAGLIGAIAFLRTKPLPDLKTVTTAVATTTQPGQPPKVVTTVQETHVEPAAPVKENA